MGFLIVLNNSIATETEELILKRLYDIELQNEQVISAIIEEKTEWDKYIETSIYDDIIAQGISIV